jgi:glutathionylspermidine synthase
MHDIQIERIATPEREDYKKKLEEIGMPFHTINDAPYWNESAFYWVKPRVVDTIERLTEELDEMCQEYVDTTVRAGNYNEFYQFTDEDKLLIERSWLGGHKALYGRFDFGYDRYGQLKMFEYNADTPTGLLEASVAQWNWKQEVFPSADQFNSIHEKLIEHWPNVATRDKNITFTTLAEAPSEDWGTVHYLLETATLAGYTCTSVDLEQLGWDGSNFVDVNNKPIPYLFKLYPWEWMKHDQFYTNIFKSNTVMIEPPWKMLLSNKLLLVELWKMFPNHPALSYAYASRLADIVPSQAEGYMLKPLLGREGQGIIDGDVTKSWAGIDHNQHYVLQQKIDLLPFDGLYPTIGSWVIGTLAAGIGFREEAGITTNNSQFVPHIIMTEELN